MSLATCSQPYKSALEIQQMLLNDMRSEETTPAVRAQQARAWKEIESLKRVMRGLPANTSQSIREPKERKAKRTPTGPIAEAPDEPIHPSPTEMPV